MPVIQLDRKNQVTKDARIRTEFISRMLEICGDVRAFYLPAPNDTTGSQDVSRQNNDWTYSKDVQTFDQKPTRLGSGTVVTFDGTDEEADSPDVDELSFGDGAVDVPFSVLALINPDTISGTDSVITKFDSGSNLREWYFTLESGSVRWYLHDQSAVAHIRQDADSALSTGTWTLVSGTYDGSSQRNGLSLYKDGLAVASTPASSGTYVAMENLTAPVGVAQQAAGGFFDGSIAVAVVTAKELTAEEQWQIKVLVNWFYGLSL